MSSCCSSKGCNTNHFHGEDSCGQLKVQGAGVTTVSASVPDKPDSCCSGESCCDPGDEESEPLASKGGDSQIWNIAGMDCPACVKKAENALSRVSGVISSHISFSTLRLQVQYAPGQNNEAGVVAAITDLGFSLSSFDEAPPEEEEPGFFKKYSSILILAALMGAGILAKSFNPEAGSIALILACVWGLIPIAKQAWSQARSGTPFGIETLMTVAAIGALALGEYFEAGMVLLLFMIGEHLEGLAASRARQGVKSLMALTPDKAVRVTSGPDGESKETVLASQLRPGDLIEILPGDRLAADCVLLTATASFDESALTGESVPVDRIAGEQVMAGSLAADRVARLKVLSEPGHNAIDRILKLIEEAEENKAPIERFVDRFSRWYTPLMMVISALVIVTPPLLLGGEWSTWVYRGLAMLLIACPCALVISTPAAVTSGLARAARQGLLIKGGAALEQLGHIQQIAFDKTGTLTEGRPQVVDIVTFGESQETVLQLAAAVEKGSRHPLAQAIVRYADDKSIQFGEADNVSVSAGKGVSGLVDGKAVVVGSPSHLKDEIGHVKDAVQGIEGLEEQGCTVVGVVFDGELIGLIAISDTLREDAEEAIQSLNKLGITSIMLTGDNPRAAAAIASRIGVDYRAGLLPEDKVTTVRELQAKAPVAMVGDGINDAPALKSAHVGIAMGNGTDVALETADAALTHEKVTDLANMIDLSRATLGIIRQNVIFAIGLKVIFLMTSLLGVTGLLLAVMADTGSTALVTLNSLRLLKKKSKYK
ncbi:zinc/cadmium/mercury/lead-transporting ATPase [Sansalvadorimonas sp. 2012CJ34-2]|uniref:P-type Zn(2+) transporter n=1 Tax=Parendozoicomonas callyspongiae TaxID=2942213 RepID=A0ABT0PH35_9GAMM|nr:zinc/cadmium/mercury/lead-transporting ATPase [Sansalvadorimonas sp. 2012CJ34-2]MCL6270695.1 zinc/cadmium/mercury/lead-transporting ATPase [Sansalvadorimonas sp. 2012CJ34-2]